MKRHVRPSSRCSPRNEVEDLRLHRHVERRGRLVAHEERRAAGERARDRHPLALAAGELVRKLRRIRRREPDLPQQLVHARHHAIGRQQLLEPDGLGDRRADAIARIERRVGILEDHLDAMALLRGVGEADRARGRRIEPCDHARERRLAAARLADETERFAATDAKAHAVDRLDRASVAAQGAAKEPLADREMARDVAHFDRDAALADRGAGITLRARQHATRRVP